MDWTVPSGEDATDSTVNSTEATAATDNSDTNLQDMSHATKWQKTNDQMNAIKQSIQNSQVLTSDLLPLQSLKDQYVGSDVNSDSNYYFVQGIDYLATKYDAIRMTRGDGNCFYRAVWYQICDYLLLSSPQFKEEGNRLVSFIKNDSMVLATSKGGYEEVALEIFYDETVEFLQRVVDQSLTHEQLHNELTAEGGVSEYCTWYLRALTASWCKAHADKFLPYLDEGYVDVTQFCASQVEPVGSEATMVAIVALVECLGVSVVIEYLDGHAFDPAKGLTSHILGNNDDSKMELAVLYRPGHYDILYPKK